MTKLVKKSILLIIVLIKEVFMQIEIPKELSQLAQLFPTDLFIVGGFIRNKIMEIEGDDIDICASLTLDEVEKILEGSDFSLKIKNKTLGSALISKGDEHYEYTTFRRDFYGDNGNHSPERVEFVTDLREDAKRRDFTCNAIYYDIKNKQIVDFYDGVADIKRRVLKTVETPEEVLSHDGVRILRLFRFQCELNFKIDKPTLQSAYKYKHNLCDVSGERVVYEITRILHSPTKYKGVSKKNAYVKALKHFNKASMWPLFGIDCNKLKFNMIKKVQHKSQGFLIDVIDTVNPISISYYLNLILTNFFGLNKKMVDQYINILSGYYAALNVQQNKPYFFKYFDNFPQILMLLSHKSKYLANKYNFFYKYIISHRLIVSVKDLKINGDTLKQHFPSMKPNRYKAILDSLLSDVFDGLLTNEPKALLSAVETKMRYL